MKQSFVWFFILIIYLFSFGDIQAESWEDDLQKAELHYVAKNYDSAIALGNIILAELETKYGKENERICKVLERLQDYYFYNYNDDMVIKIGYRCLEILRIQKQKDGNTKVNVLVNISMAMRYKNKLEKSFELLQEANTIFSKLANPNHKNFIKISNEISKHYVESGDFPMAEKHLKEIVAYIKKDKSIYESEILQRIVNLGHFYAEKASFKKAEETYKEALKIGRGLKNPDSDDLAFILIRLITVNKQLGRYEQADLLFEQVIQEVDKISDKNSLDYGRLLIRISLYYLSKSKYELAEQCLIDAKVIYDKKGQHQYSQHSWLLQQYGKICYFTYRNDEAESYLLESINLGLKSYLDDHIYFQGIYTFLGNIYTRKKEFDKAEKFLDKAIEIGLKRYNDYNPYLFHVYTGFSKLYVSNNEYEKAISSYNRKINSSKLFIDNVFPNSTETQKLNWIRAYQVIDDSYFSFALKSKNDNAIENAFNMTVLGKSLVLDALMTEKEIYACFLNDHLFSLYEERNEVRSNISKLILDKNNDENINQLLVSQDSLETELSQACGSFKSDIEVKNLNLQKVKELLPSDAVYWEFVRYNPYNFETAKVKDSTYYLAFIVDKDNPTQIVDLGNTLPIDKLVSQTHKLVDLSKYLYTDIDITESENKFYEKSKYLYKILFEPLIKRSNNKTNIFISPDASLNLLSFNTLMLPNNSYVIENYKINNLTSAKDLVVHEDNVHDTSNDALLFAAPNYDSYQQPHETLQSINTKNKAYKSVTKYGPFRGVTDCLNSEFSSLRYSKYEAENIARLLQENGNYNVQKFYGTNASEKLLKKISNPPKILHFATHGFYCDTDKNNSFVDNPLLKSCLVLSGANQVVRGLTDTTLGSEDGILTAYEVSGLNLHGTELVTLSACETGLGKLLHDEGINGEGIFGLRRAFLHAGAKSILLSLWKVPDKQTADFMGLFYKAWLSGSNKTDAMRNSMLQMLQKAKTTRSSSHPYYWSGFILIGNSN